jgi:hypothetical protein
MQPGIFDLVRYDGAALPHELRNVRVGVRVERTAEEIQLDPDGSARLRPTFRTTGPDGITFETFTFEGRYRTSRDTLYFYGGDGSVSGELEILDGGRALRGGGSPGPGLRDLHFVEYERR